MLIILGLLLQFARFHIFFYIFEVKKSPGKIVTRHGEKNEDEERKCKETSVRGHDRNSRLKSIVSMNLRGPFFF